MKRIALWLAFVAAVTLTLSPMAQADCRRVVAVKRAVVVEKVVVVEKAVVPVVAVFPLYSAVHIPALIGPPPVGVQGPQQQNADVPPWAQKLIGAVEQIDQRLQRLEGGGQPQQQRMPPADPRNGGREQAQGGGGLASLVQLSTQYGCVRCHDKAKPEGGLALFDKGQPLDWSPETTGQVIGEVLAGRMPRGQKLTSDQKVAFIQTLTGGEKRP